MPTRRKNHLIYGGIVLIAELDKKLKITEQFVKYFRDYRHPYYVDYSINQLLAQIIYSIILGYEDINDHEHLRYDSAIAIAVQKLNCNQKKEPILAGKITLNRLEYSPNTMTNKKESRYHKIEALVSDIEKTFVDIFIQSHTTPPKNIILDLDVTDEPVHGNQEGAFFKYLL